MRRYLLLALLFFCCGSVVAQSLPSDTLAEHYAQTITQEELREHLQIIASDDMEGRETGKPGQKKAAAYIAGYFAGLDLPPVVGDTSYYQIYPIVQSEWREPYVEINAKRFTFLEDFFSFFHFADPIDTSFSQVIFAGYGISSEKYDDYENINVTGQAIMVLAGEPQNKNGKYYVTNSTQPSRFTKNLMASLGTKRTLAGIEDAALVMVVDDEFKQHVNRYAMVARRPTLALKDYKPSSNLIIISPKMAQALSGKNDLKKLKQRIDKRGRTTRFTSDVSLEVDLQQSIEQITSENVLGYIEGSDRKDELVVVTAHYDHIGKQGEVVNNGADDDGSGTVAVLEIAEAFAEAKKAGYHPRRSLLFMTVSGEEKGLFGSKYYTEYPIFPLKSTIANLNIDMIGRIDPPHTQDSNYVYIIGSDRLSTELHQINERMNKTYTQLDLDYRYNAKDDPNRFYYRSDHYNFAKNNIPVIFYFNGTHPDYHRPTDTIEKINFGLLQKRAQLVFHTAWQLANQDERILVDKGKTENGEGRPDTGEE
ncbi:M28 family peptidase [Tunicatimonas pelagia]|uniref:M28 family peptidase n=1 Tax=Tunicatimonas pelagia TaxID=931531 RepID=UPI0026656637|nr:M28 family peptidase [Tunicatimonas pelagia]WKN42381.1 M28 family peptidase [Tunicatimonas pelagia]